MLAGLIKNIPQSLAKSKSSKVMLHRVPMKYSSSFTLDHGQLSPNSQGDHFRQNI